MVAAGDVGPTEAVLWARSPGAGPVVIALGRAGQEPARRVEVSATAARDFTVKVPVSDLAPATRYAYRVAWEGESRDPRRVRLVWSGDLGGAGLCRRPEGYGIFRAMEARQPDSFVFAGDTVYADRRCPAPPNLPGADFVARTLRGYRAKARYHRGDAVFAQFLAHTSVYAIWDDHEVRNDFAGPGEPLMELGRQAFLEYWPIVPPAEEPGRLYRRARWGRLAELFILDTRQYRSPNTEADGAGKTMLGAAQLQWLLDGLAGTDAVWKLVVSSVPLSIPTGRPLRDGWANGSHALDPDGSPMGFERELGVIVTALETRRIRNVVWLVADVHRAEVIRHDPRPGVTFHELVAGPLSASMTVPWLLDDTLRPTRLFAAGGFANFGELTVDPRGLTVRIVDGRGSVRFERTLTPAGAA
jgi:alkaline phosphatase D